jgi:hypothetical protein
VVVSLGRDSRLSVLTDIAKTLNGKPWQWMLLHANEDEEGVFASLHVSPEGPKQPGPKITYPGSPGVRGDFEKTEFPPPGLGDWISNPLPWRD